ncbi:MAG: cytochrome c [Planctomycetaceae bacterium]|nr:cytochrome c [Planctomycetaceae bacterium]
MFKSVSRSYVAVVTTGVVAVGLGIVQGCATMPATAPANVAAPVPPTNVADHSTLASGRKIYVSFLKCAMCHRPKPVSDYSAEMWAEDILPRMAKKARLSPEQYADVLAYVTANTTQQ